MFSMSRHDFTGKSPRQILPEKRRKHPLRDINICAYWNQFQGNACTKLISYWDEL